MNKSDILNKIKENGIKKAYVLATFYNNVCIGYYENDEIYFYNDVNFKLCTEIRIFNKDLELKIIKIDEKIYTKLIKDSDYSDRLNDEYMYISGNKILATTEKYTVIEQINKKIAVPLVLTENEVKDGIRLVVRNYCDTDKNNQVIITDSRLVGFSKDEKEVI